MKSISRVIGNLNLEANPLSIITLNTMLLSISELINSTPMASIIGEKEAILKLITPSILVGKFKGRTLLKPICLPTDTTNVVKDIEEKWTQLIKIYSDVIIPALLTNTKWYKDRNNEPVLGATIMFKKRGASNFLPQWSLGTIVQLHQSADSKIRSVTIEYSSGSNEVDEISYEEYKVNKLTKRRTVRDSNSIIVLHPLADSLNDDLKQLHYDLETMDQESTMSNPPRCLIQHQDIQKQCSDCIQTTNSDKCAICIMKEIPKQLSKFNIKINNSNKEIIQEIIILINRQELLNIITNHQPEYSTKTLLTKILWNNGQIEDSIKYKNISYDQHNIEIYENDKILKSILTNQNTINLKQGKVQKLRMIEIDNTEVFKIHDKIRWRNNIHNVLSIANHSCDQICCCNEHCKILHQH